MKRKYILRCIIITLLIVSILYFMSPYLLGINCEENDAGKDVIGLEDSYFYNHIGEYGFSTELYESNEDETIYMLKKRKSIYVLLPE